MKKALFLTLMIFALGSVARADRHPIVINNGGAVDDRFDWPLPADAPDVYYDDAVQMVIIEGLGVVNYYDVEIVSQSSLLAVLTCVVDGTYDTVDISSLPDDYYLISIHTPLGNTYEGTLSNY